MDSLDRDDRPRLAEGLAVGGAIVPADAGVDLQEIEEAIIIWDARLFDTCEDGLQKKEFVVDVHAYMGVLPGVRVVLVLAVGSLRVVQKMAVPEGHRMDGAGVVTVPFVEGGGHRVVVPDVDRRTAGMHFRVPPHGGKEHPVSFLCQDVVHTDEGGDSFGGEFSFGDDPDGLDGFRAPGMDSAEEPATHRSVGIGFDEDREDAVKITDLAAVVVAETSEEGVGLDRVAVLVLVREYDVHLVAVLEAEGDNINFVHDIQINEVVVDADGDGAQLVRSELIVQRF